jgi:hypothetical protein
MSTSSTPTFDSSRPHWPAHAAGVALACALLPVVPLLWAVPGSALFVNGPYVSIVLAVAALAATRRTRAGHTRLMAWTALAATGGWNLLLVAFGLALRFA